MPSLLLEDFSTLLEFFDDRLCCVHYGLYLLIWDFHILVITSWFPPEFSLCHVCVCVVRSWKDSPFTCEPSLLLIYSVLAKTSVIHHHRVGTIKDICSPVFHRWRNAVPHLAETQLAQWRHEGMRMVHTLTPCDCSKQMTCSQIGKHKGIIHHSYLVTKDSFQINIWLSRYCFCLFIHSVIHHKFWVHQSFTKTYGMWMNFPGTCFVCHCYSDAG